MSSTRSIVPAGGPTPRLLLRAFYGDLLGGATELDRVELALVADERPEQVPWMSRPAHLEALAAFLRFDKLPLSWQWRPRLGRSGITRSIGRCDSGRVSAMPIRPRSRPWRPVISKPWRSTRRSTRTRSWRNWSLN